MKKVTAFVGSARKKHTYNATKTFLEQLQLYGNIEYEIVRLSEYNLEACRGCKLCFDKGEEMCPLDDDRDNLIEKIHNSNGIIFATPNYAFQVSGYMKTFIDRLSFFLHRPHFFDKTFTSIVAQGVFGGKKIISYLSRIGNGLGMNVVKGCCIKTLEPIQQKQKTQNNNDIKKLSKEYYSHLKENNYPTPSILELALFRISRTNIKINLDENYKDYLYYKDNGWFESKYYYDVKLNPLKKLAGRIFDNIGLQMSKNS
jgi:multimeric flavodoxin WrbA